MFLLLETTITIDQSSLITTCIAIVGLVLTLVGILHNDIKKKIQGNDDSLKAIHEDLKPITITVAVHAEKINEVKADNKAIVLRLDNHEKRIHKLEIAS